MPVDLAAVRERAGAPEPEEVPRLVVAWPELAPAARHGLAGEVLEAIEPHTEADPAALLTTLLASFGALVGSGPHALADGAEHPARVWPLVVGDTSKARKGSSWAQVRQILHAADRAFTEGRVLAGFGSGEALVDSVAGDEDRRLLIVESEYARTLSVAKREGSTLATLLRQAWDGGRLQVRSRAGTAVAEGAHVVVIGHITRAELLAKVAESDALGGSLNRFLIVGARRSKLLPSGGGLDDATVADFGRKVAFVAGRARTVGRLSRTGEAEELWSEVYAELADDDPGGLLGAVVARDAAQMLRLSVAYALLDGSPRIEAAHVLAARAVWDYARASAAAVFDRATGDQIADRILAELQRCGPGGLDLTGVRDLFSRHARRERIDQAIALLERRGLATKATKATQGRPKTIVRLATKATEATKGASVASDEPPPPDDGDLARWEAEEESESW